MKTYKIEFVTVNKKFMSVTVDAENRSAALSLARSMKEDEFEQVESIHGSEWKIRGSWGILDFFGIGK